MSSRSAPAGPPRCSAAKLCPQGHDDGGPRAGDAPLDVPGLRPRPRQPPLLGALRDDGRPRARDVDVAAEPERAGAADAAVRHRSTPARASAAPRSTGRRSSGGTSSTTSATAPTSSSATARRRSPRARTIQDWGISYDELEPYYDAFEWDIGASGNAGNIHGKIRPGGNPFEAPRSRGYPNPPLAVTPHGDMFAQRLQRTSASTRSPNRPGSPRARSPTRTATTAPAASTAASAPGSAARSTPRQARSTPTSPSRSPPDNYEVRLGCKVLRIETGDRRPRDRRHLRRRARQRALPARRSRHRLRLHAREQPAALALTQQGSTRRDRQRSRPRRAELHLPDLPADRRPGSGRARS